MKYIIEVIKDHKIMFIDENTYFIFLDNKFPKINDIKYTFFKNRSFKTKNLEFALGVAAKIRAEENIKAYVLECKEMS